jgi:hypothetical protein
MGHSIDTTMRSMMRPGRAIPDVKPLTDLGLSDEAGEYLHRLFLDHKGDVDAVEAAFRQAKATGSAETFRQVSSWADPEDVVAMERLGFYDDIQDALKAGDQEEASRLWMEALEEVREEAAHVVDEVPLIDRESEFVQDGVAMGEARRDGYLDNVAVNESNNRFVATENANMAYREALDEFRDLVNRRLGEAIEQLRASGDSAGANRLGRAADDLYSEFRPRLGDLEGEGAIARRNFWQSIYSWRDKIHEMPAGTDWGQVWKNVGIAGEPPRGLTRSALLNTMFDGHARPIVDGMARGVRDMRAVTNEDFATRLGALVGIRPNTGKFNKARQHYFAALEFDRSAILKGGRPYKFPVGGIELSAEGVDNTKHMLNAINANLPEGMAKFDSLHSVPPAVAQAAIEKRAIARAQEVLRNAEAVTVEELVARGFSEEIAEQMLGGKLEDAVRESYLKFAEDFGPDSGLTAGNYEAWLDRIRLQDPAPEDLALWGSKEAWIDNLGLDVTTRKALEEVAEARGLASREDAIRLLLDEPVQVEELIPPYSIGSTPSASRAWHENLPEIERLFQRVDDGMRQNWGASRPVVVNDEVEAALKTYLKEADGKIAEARLLASQEANAKADFTLLLYPEKRNLDMALQYVYPYHFWYNRTYMNWMKRSITNPEILAGYARYRETLEKIHAGAPEWWKYSINSDELLGIETDHPLFFNLETTLNPLNGLIGVDFDDPKKRTGWFTTMLQEINKLGPSTWTPWSFATAAALYQRGEDEAAERWAGILIPQTTTLRTLATLATGEPVGAQLPFFWGGMGPFERRRVGRALTAMDNEGLHGTADLLDAAFNQKGDLWDEAVVRQVTERAPGQLASFFAGAGFRARSQSDIEIDQFYSDWFRFWQNEPNLHPNEVRNGLEQLRQQYPFMDTLLLSRKGGIDRDRAFAYNVLGRIPPAQSDDFAELVGIDERLFSRFYDDKGHIEQWVETDRDRFMSGIIDLAAVLDMPTEATREEWNAARTARVSMQEEAKKIWGDNIWERVDAYFGARTDEGGGGEEAEKILAQDPAIGEALDFQAERFMQSPTMAAYYSSIEKVEKYYEGVMWDAIEKELGSDIWDKWDTYWFLVDVDPKEARAYFKANPELERYGELKDEFLPLVKQKAIQIGQLLPEGQGATLREIEDEMGLGAQDVRENFPQVTPGDFTTEMIQEALGPAAFSLALDVLQGDTLPLAAEESLDELAISMGLNGWEDVINLLAQSAGIDSLQAVP